jgi:hypothetical protein
MSSRPSPPVVRAMARAGTCLQLVLTLADGSKHRADFDFRK